MTSKAAAVMVMRIMPAQYRDIGPFRWWAIQGSNL
jgi:hypothetical protein